MFGLQDKVDVSSGYLSTILSPTGGLGTSSAVVTLHSQMMSISEGEFSSHEAENGVFIHL